MMKLLRGGMLFLSWATITLGGCLLQFVLGIWKGILSAPNGMKSDCIVNIDEK
jgi:hypothetical protein